MLKISPSVRASNLAQANHKAVSPAGLLESILAIEDKLGMARPDGLDLPAAPLSTNEKTQADALAALGISPAQLQALKTAMAVPVAKKKK